MSIETNEEDGAVRGLLGTAFADAEPPLRDLASGSIARGDAAKRRNRVLAAGGAALSVVAVIGTFAAVAGTTPAKHGRGSVGNQVMPGSPTSSPSGRLPFGPIPARFDKQVDVGLRMPGLLQPLLPQGITVESVKKSMSEATLAPALLTGATGTNQVTMWVGTAPPDHADLVKAVACPASGTTCQTRSVAGGTAYIQEKDTTAGDLVRGAGSQVPAGSLQAGAAGKVVAKSLSVMFVPDDRTKYAFNFAITTKTATLQWADHKPSNFPTGAEWPPQLVLTDQSLDSAGLLMSADDAVAMLAKPGLDKLEYLLDPRTAVSQETQAKFAQVKSQIAVAAAPALPSGVKADFDTSFMFQPKLLVTGPTGKNTLRWETGDQKTLRQSIKWCPPNVECSNTPVSGGTLEVWKEKPMDSNGSILSTDASAYQYWFFPSDPSKPGVTMTLGTDASQTGGPTRSITDPGHTYSVADGPYAPVQVSADQFLAAAESGQLATAIAATTTLVAQLS